MQTNDVRGPFSGPFHPPRPGVRDVLARLTTAGGGGVTPSPPGTQISYSKKMESPQREVARSSAGAGVVHPPPLSGLFAQHTPRYDIRRLTPCKIMILGQKMIPGPNSGYPQSALPMGPCW